MASFSYEVFTTVVKKKTFFAAAKVLNVTPSAVSHSINQLEKDLGFPIFIRHRTGVQLTADGQRILPIVQQILNTENRLVQEANDIKGLNAGLVRIGAFSSVCINWLPDIIRSFHKQYPQIEIQLIQGTFNDIAEQVRIGSIDIGFSSLPVSDQLLVTPLIKDPIYCITPKEFQPENGKFVTDSDIGKRNFILQQGDYDKDTKQALDRYNVTPNSISYSIDDQSILSMVESGLGLGILPKLALQKLTGAVNHYPFSEAFNRTLCLIVNKIQAQSPATRHMLEEIHTYLQNRYGAEFLD
ncbi:cysb-like cys regulon transcriptional activator [Agrilactobacillus composti DSM 18527 = JCM 14202]|uniref:Cysb-like cys regulon transcriptional activator n=1 Tax=Agrilactobacillus composti DSM 18527 = JCM 14202 TaxID=1423734 RepID=X0PIH8_9LACO|nr:LysR family transcriptional regulator [Agrilactobacillus composti]KRM32906.1 cysb-like cys regulon transcriptional activator [Agrilactobacillus composti DSM 18527 = JCM 14202]GAF41908.1 LysR family transcriptional regulator [Agrilactobacillus composti DSM 18527 = JCM 14202]